MNNEELDKLRVQQQRWNKQCHPEDQIDWIEFLEDKPVEDVEVLVADQENLELE